MKLNTKPSPVRVLPIDFQSFGFKPTVSTRLRQFGEICIESGIPVCEPSLSGPPKTSIRLAVEALQVGESFLVSKDAYRSGRIKSLAKQAGIKVVCRVVNGINRRVWRTA